MSRYLSSDIMFSNHLVAIRNREIIHRIFDDELPWRKISDRIFLPLTGEELPLRDYSYIIQVFHTKLSIDLFSGYSRNAINQNHKADAPKGLSKIAFDRTSIRKVISLQFFAGASPKTLLVRLFLRIGFLCFGRSLYLGLS